MIRRYSRASALGSVLALILLSCCQQPRSAGLHLAEHRLDLPLRRTESRRPLEKLSPGLRRSPGASGRVLVDLTIQLDLRRLGREMARRGAGRRERRDLTVAALAHVAEETQGRLRPALEQLQARGLVTAWRGYSVVNRLLVEASPAGIRALARLSEVAAIVEETESDHPVWMATPRTLGSIPGRQSWAIAAIGADRAWRRGLDGRGVLVGIIDAGASAAHEQLAGGFAGHPGGWRDPRERVAEPLDGAFGHGTGVLSCAVGRNLGGITLGVAPGARWAACAGLPEGRYNNALMMDCADWMLNVAQPDVLINAWLLPTEGCDPSLRPILDAWRAAEILPVFTAGNLGPENRSPANYADLYPGGSATLSVGGLRAGGELFERSATGPSRCDPSAVFPSLVAPAHDLVTALPLTPSAYRQAEGTSFAAGLVAGAAAILLQSDPEAAVVELERALREGAADLGAPGSDNRFGWGGLDLPGALQALERLRAARAVDPSANARQSAANQSP